METELQNQLVQEKLNEGLETIIHGFNLEGLEKSEHGVYKSILEKLSQGTNLDEAYASELSYLNEDEGYVETLSRFLKGRPVVDLGAGTVGFAFNMLQKAGISGYVACEAHWSKN